MAILFATLLFSVFCSLTFVAARHFRTYDYRSFFKHLLGPLWPAFELAYLLFVVLILAVYGAAAGAIGNAVFGAPDWAGTVALMAGIAGVVAFGNKSVERLFNDVSYLLYGVYALFIVLALAKFGDRIPGGFAAHPQTAGWALGGLTYSGYNIIGAVVILPVAAPPHQRPRRGRRRSDLRAADDAAGPAVLHSDGRFLSRDSGADAAVRLSAAADGHAGVPPAVPGDDLRGAARKRGRLGARDQRAHRPRLAARTRQVAVAPRASADRPGACSSAACSSPAASASSR